MRFLNIKKKKARSVTAMLLCAFMLLNSVPAAALEGAASAPQKTISTAEEAQPTSSPDVAKPEQSQSPEITAEPQPLGDDVDAAIGCRLTPRKESYASGDAMQFTLTAQFADPGDESTLRTVKLGIDLPDTDPEAKLPMFSRVGTGDYAGCPMYSLSQGGNTVNLYLVTLSSGQRRIEFSLNAGETLQGTLSVTMPNGVSAPMDAFTLTPKVLSEGDYGKTEMIPGSAAVTAQFGWNDVKLSASTNNIGNIEGTERDPDRIIVTATADSKTNGQAKDAIFCEKYVTTATTSLNSMYIEDGELTSSESGGVSSFFVGGVKVLEVEKPLSSLVVEKQLGEEGKITGFSIEHTALNTTLDSANPQPLPNQSLKATLFTASLRLDGTHLETTLETVVDFDAYSPFYNEEEGKTGEEYHQHSTAGGKVYATDNYKIKKTVYKDAACEEPFDSENDFMEDGDTYYYKIVATNGSGQDSSNFIIEDVLPDGLIYQGVVSGGNPSKIEGKSYKWNNVSIAAGASKTIVLKTQFDLDKISGGGALQNVANLSSSLVGPLDSAVAQTTFRAGNSTDSDISYEKKAKEAGGGEGDPLTFTIDVKNENKTAAKYITVQDNWPGDTVTPVSASVAAPATCQEIVLVDTEGHEHPMGADLTGLTIAKIQFKGLYVPAGRTVRLTINSLISQDFDQLVNTVQTGTDGTGTPTPGAPAYGVSVNKTAHQYTDAEGVGKQLDISTLVNRGDVVCYKVSVNNLKDSPLTDVTMTDPMPDYLPLTEGTVGGTTGQILMERAGVVTVADIAKDGSGNWVTNGFDLAAKETVTFYFFIKMDEAAMAKAKDNHNCVTNEAFASFHGLNTGKASANFYVYEDRQKTVSIEKMVSYIANYDEDMKLVDTDQQDWKLGNGNVKNNITSIREGNYVAYRIRVLQHSAAGYYVPLYEVGDTLPEGLDFVGVLKSGYVNGPATWKDLGKGQYLQSGETGTWSNNITSYPYEAQITPEYDPATRKLRIIINNGQEPIQLYDGRTYPNESAYFFVLARATKNMPSFTNYAEAKVDKDIVTGGTCKDRTEGGYKYIGQKVTTYSVNMVPGITKTLYGHYYEDGPVSTTNNIIDPNETLRYQVELKNQDNSTNYTAPTGSTAVAPTYSYLKDYTVTDILPAEYSYKPGSSSLLINRTYDIVTGEKTDVTPPLHDEPTAYKATTTGWEAVEPTVEEQEDGTTKLTWTFTGNQYRILNVYMDTKNAQYKGMGFMNILTYDAARRPEYATNYGSYTNTATVKHSYDFGSVSTGAPDYTQNTITASTIVNVFGAAGTLSNKIVVNEDGDEADSRDSVTGENRVNTEAGQTLRYTMEVQNATEESTVGRLVFIDELPREENDTGVVNRIDRKSDFGLTLADNPNLEVKLVREDGTESVISPDDYDVSYGLSVGAGLRAKGDWSAGSGGYINWGSVSTDMNALRVLFDEDYTISSKQKIRISFTAQVPETLSNNEELTPGSTAWNSFGYSYQAKDAEGEMSDIIRSEPQKVGAHLPGVQLMVTKKVTGADAPADKAFTFRLTLGGAPKQVGYRVNGSDTLLYTDADGRFTLFGGQTATLYVSPATGLRIWELAQEMPDDFEFVNVTGDGNADPNSPQMFEYVDVPQDGDRAGALFTNNYISPVHTNLDLSVTKTLEGNVLPESKRFTFTIRRTDDGAASDVTMPSEAACAAVTGAMTSGTSEELRFGNIVFNAAGRYSFEVAETATGITGMTDAAPQTVYVLVTKTEGALNAVFVDEDNNPVPGGNKLNFVNTYDPRDAQLALSVEKTIDSKQGSALLSASSFTFGLSLKSGDADSVTLPAQTSITTAAITSGTTAPVSFGNITFSSAGVYVFTVSETATGIAGMTDAADRDVTVTVTDEDGVLQAEVTTPTTGGELNFTNTYDAATITKAALQITKRIAGDALPTAKTFTFELALTEGDPTGVALPAKTTVTTAALTQGSADPVGFGDITFFKTGDYTFTISEQATGIAGMTDADAQTITVRVTEQDGMLTPEILDRKGALEFVNTYDPQDAQLALSVKKTVSGTALPTAKAFEFKLVLDQGDPAHVTLPNPATVTTPALTHGTTAAVPFGEITFDAAGTYVFEVTETASGITDMTDAAAQTVTVVVTDEGGTLRATVTEGSEELTFVNVYDPAPTPTPTPTVKPTPTPTVKPNPTPTKKPHGGNDDPDETPEPTVAPTPAPTHGPGATGPLTGDESPADVFGMLFAIALIGFVFVAMKRRNRHSEH